MNVLLELILEKAQLIVFLAPLEQNQVLRALLVKNVQKGLIQAQVLQYAIPVLQADILPQVHQHAMSVLQELNLIVKNLVVMNVHQEHFH